MTQRTKSDLATQISTLLADNTAGNISAADVRSVFTDSKDSLVGGPTSATDNTLPRFDSTTGQLIQGSNIVVDDTDNMSAVASIALANGGALKTTTTTAHTAVLQAYDVDDATYRTFATLTNGNTPSFAITAPAGGTVAINGASIGNSTAGSGSFTTLATSGDVVIGSSKLTVAATSGNTAIVGTLDVTGILTCASDKTDYKKFLGLTDVINYSAGTWTTTRVARGDYVKRKTAADDTTIIGIDITEAIRTTASKGFKLNSFDVIFRNTTADLDAHSVTLDKITYTDSAVVTTTSVALTGTLGTGQDADPQIDNVTIDTPAFNVTDDSKYVLEITVNAAAGSVYDFIGVMLKFARNDL
jgi:hypothetical protein